MQSKTSAAFLLVGTFLLGGITGGVSYSIYRGHFRPESVRAAQRPGGGRSNIVEDLARDLSLDPDQKEKLKVIIGKTRERYRELHKQMGPEFQKIRNEGDEEIRGILRPDQKVRFGEILRDIAARRNSKGGGDRPPRKQN
jgi:hypothetical protein